MGIENKQDMEKLTQEGDQVVQNVQEDLMAKGEGTEGQEKMDDGKMAQLEKDGEDLVQAINEDLATKDEHAA